MKNNESPKNQSREQIFCVKDEIKNETLFRAYICSLKEGNKWRVFGIMM